MIWLRRCVSASVPHQDLGGSPTLHINSASVSLDEYGTVLEAAEYLPFGSPRASEEITSTDYTFTDQEKDRSTGLFNYDARHYDPRTGRFVSPDSILPDPYDPQQLNRYAYARNNPLRYVDPSGRDFVLLNDSDGARGYGHNASLVGTDEEGWDYNSKDGPPIITEGNVHKRFDKIKSFFEDKISERYDRTIRVKTTPEEDTRMKNEGSERFNKAYSFWEIKDTVRQDNFGENCADLTGHIGQAGGVDVKKPKEEISPLLPPITIPNLQYKKLLEDEKDRIVPTTE